MILILIIDDWNRASINSYALEQLTESLLMAKSVDDRGTSSVVSAPKSVLSFHVKKLEKLREINNCSAKFETIIREHGITKIFVLSWYISNLVPSRVSSYIFKLVA
jgi:hypothetical protein